METDEAKQKPSFFKSRLWACVGVVIILGVLFCLSSLTPNYVGNGISAQEHRRFACINNLRQIDGAKQSWALETKASTNATPTWDDIKPYCFRGGTNVESPPKCPSGGVYTIGNLQTAPTCSVKGHVLE
jgi:hypothetical protein